MAKICSFACSLSFPSLLWRARSCVTFCFLSIYFPPAAVLIWRQTAIRSILAIMLPSPLSFKSKWKNLPCFMHVSMGGIISSELLVPLIWLTALCIVLMSFTHGWMRNNHPLLSDPELFFTPPPPPIFLTFSLSHSLREEVQTLGSSRER